IAANTKAIDNEAAARDKADQQEASERKAADSQLNKTMTSGFATIQGQQDEQDAKIGKNQKDIQTNAGKIQNNQDAIKANSDKLDNHEGRIAGNENNIATNAKNISKEISARQDADTALQKNIDKEASARGDKDKEHDTAIAANKKAIGDEAAARQADISRLDNKIHDVSKEVDTVGALSMAMSGLHPLSYDEGDARFQLSAAVGTYDGTEALALGGFYHFNRDSMLSVGVATDLGADEHRMGANVGYTRRIGQGGHVSRPSEGTVSDIMKDIKNLEQKQAKLEQENEQLKQQLAALKK
ncbi:YadA C-terminal domain-containing protein, partial [uncultured Dialister sp.]|uniref:YadA C-terminal domain-containing protein n=2 Tax=uncultured Dialister sp. TaxID=278064 RepID=UPI0025D15107